MNINNLISCAWKAFPDTVARKLSGGSIKAFRFQKLISKTIADAVTKGGGRIIISVPPQHGKSEIGSKWTPVWFLENFPHKRVILCSYEFDYAASYGRKVRNTISGTGDLAVKLSEDSTAAFRFDTTAGGGMQCAGAGGPITGKPGDLIIIDDPHKNWKEAQSTKKRHDIIDWYNSTVYTRQQPGTTIIVIQTRWHERDLAGYLLKESPDEWTEIRLPALAEKDDPLGREPGEPLCPERFPKDVLQKMEQSLGAQMFAALYQQKPSALKGNIYLREYWRRYSALPPHFIRVVQSWDTAFEKGEEHSQSACTVWGETDTGIYLLDKWADYIEFPELKEQMKRMSKRYPSNAILLEDKATGKPLRQSLRRETRLPIVEVQPIGDKVARAHAATPFISSGTVFLPEGAAWADDFIDTLANFPNTEQTDVADTVSQAILYLCLGAALHPSDIQSRHTRLVSKLMGGGFSFDGISTRDFS